MSTKAIHEALDRFRDLLMDVGAPPDGDDMECVLRARDEVNAIERAAKVLHADNTSIDEIQNAVDLLHRIAKEAP